MESVPPPRRYVSVELSSAHADALLGFLQEHRGEACDYVDSGNLTAAEMRIFDACERARVAERYSIRSAPVKRLVSGLVCDVEGCVMIGHAGLAGWVAMHDQVLCPQCAARVRVALTSEGAALVAGRS
jgi:hypothetical protein